MYRLLVTIKHSNGAELSYITGEYKTEKSASTGIKRQSKKLNVVEVERVQWKNNCYRDAYDWPVETGYKEGVTL